MPEAGKAQAGAKEKAEGLWGTSESEKTVAVNTPASAGAQQAHPAVPSLPRIAMGPDVRNVNADHSKANIAQENIIVNYPAGYLLGGIVRVCFAPLLRFRFSVSAPACTDTSLRSPPPPDSENRCAFRLGVFGRAVTSAGLLKRECPGSDMPSRSNNSRVFRWD